MSAFGFDGALTSLGSFGTGFTNSFDADVVELCNIQVICEKLDDLLEFNDAVTIIVNSTSGSVGNLTTVLESMDTRIKLIQSDIDTLRKRTRYWEDRNLLGKSNKEIKGRGDFKDLRQGGGDDAIYN